MSEVNDPAIKLFGTNINININNEDFIQPPTSPSDLMNTSPKAIEMPEDIHNIEDSDDEDGNPVSEGHETTSTEENADGIDKSPETSKATAFKKPDKIIPCPRCNSMETKFCYFNNYNVNQPRHFCRSCQRYWTAGGAIRNVPVGAGRRKSKHASPQLQPVVIPCNGGSFTQVNLINPDSPLCKSMTNKLTLEEPNNFSEASTRKNETPQDTVHKEKVDSSGVGGGFSPFHTLQGFPGPPPWNYGWNGVAYGVVPWNSPTVAISPALCVPNMAFPFVPPMCWGWDTTTRNLSSNSSLSPGSCSENSGCSGVTSSCLGKHSRDCNSKEEEKNEKSLWIPKTLRIADPEEAAKSSIWSTLGIKPGKNEPISTRGMFKAFQPRDERNRERSKADEALIANPAALSRSKAFQENT